MRARCAPGVWVWPVPRLTKSLQAERDPFADDVLERLARSNRDYQNEHGHYIVPLAERLLAARAEIRDLKKRLGYPRFAR